MGFYVDDEFWLYVLVLFVLLIIVIVYTKPKEGR